MKRICVFCGASAGYRKEYATAAVELGQAMVQRQVGLVYGGGRRGLMGTIARTVHEAGGEVIGVIPRVLAVKELAFEEAGDLRTVGSMHERKALMAELSDAFIAMPGGFGTLDELFETVTWAQLGIHDKPVGLLNVEEYFDSLISMIDRAVLDGFIKADHRDILIDEKSPEKLLDMISEWRPRPIDKIRWIASMDES